MLPTLAYRVSDGHGLGISLIAAYQRLKVQGGEHVGLANPGFDHSTGYGFGLGWTGKVSSHVSLGASYFSRVRMDKLDKYTTLLAGQGEFDIPERISLGVAIQATSNLTVGADVVRVNWHEVRSLGNSITSPGSLGASKEPGFGWKNQSIYRVGADYRYSDSLSLRAGYSTGDRIIPREETALNYLAPVTPRRHLSVGATWALSPKTELSVVYTRALDERVAGIGPSAGIDPRHSQHWLGVAWGWTL